MFEGVVQGERGGISPQKVWTRKGEKTMKIWYAVMKDTNDDDWGYGSYDLGEAVAMLNQQGYEEGYILAIDDDAKVALEVVEV